jgi:hypothetical protein
MKYVLIAAMMMAIAAPAQAKFAGDADEEIATAPVPGNEGGAAASVGARERGAINRVRSSLGGAQYKPTTKCTNSDVNIGTNSNQPTYVGSLNVVSGSACPRYMQDQN